MDTRFKQPEPMSFAETVADQRTHLAQTSESAQRAIDTLRSSAAVIHDYLLCGHDATDAAGYAIAMEVYALQHRKLVSAGHEPATLFALCAQHITALARERMLMQAPVLPGTLYTLEVR